MRSIALVVFLVSCNPRPEVDIISMPSPPLATCNELCASTGRSCSDEAFEAPNGETGGQLVSYGCGTCYGGSEWLACDGTKVAARTTNKSGPLIGSQCGCSR